MTEIKDEKILREINEMMRRDSKDENIIRLRKMINRINNENLIKFIGLSIYLMFKTVSVVIVLWVAIHFVVKYW